ncbi:M14 family metallopeptidase [Parvibaculum sp.]|uniref:M14 family metallopeptidase n=1 Tax=Parvibaculum sp. TaxID=2024848 RepID=UPI00321044DA
MTATTGPFARSYAEARARFLAAAGLAGARVTSEMHPLRGPDGEELAIDAALIGPAGASKLLAMTSGTHGIEGYTGSAIQSKLLEEGLGERLPQDTALLFIHAVNPWGFAHGRRVNEDNIDLNRNFTTPPFPENTGYALLHDALVPREWTEETRAKSRAAQGAFIKEHGIGAFVAALSAGQYTHPTGLFYGGQGPSWSNRIMREIFEREFLPRRTLAFIDIHTGLGERGAGELLCTERPGHPVFELARQWLGSDVRSTSAGTSVSADVRGSMKSALIDLLASDGRPRQTMAISIEYGTVPQDRVGAALQADNWLYQHGDPASPQGREIAREMRAVFLVEEADWAETIHEQAARHVGNALKGLAGA